MAAEIIATIKKSKYAILYLLGIFLANFVMGMIPQKEKVVCCGEPIR